MVVKFTNFLHLQSLQLTFPRSTMYTPGDRQDQGIRKIPEKRKLTYEYFQGGEKVIDYIVTFEGMGGGVQCLNNLMLIVNLNIFEKQYTIKY